MEHQVTEKDLYVALSYLFAEAEPPYEYIHKVVSHFPLAVVETAFFNYVGPYCYPNLMSPIPPVYEIFDEQELLDNIKKRKHEYQTLRNKLLRYFLRFYLSSLWSEFSEHIERIESNSKII